MTLAKLAAFRMTFPVLVLACLAAVTKARPYNPSNNPETGIGADKFGTPSLYERMSDFGQPGNDDTADKQVISTGFSENKDVESESGTELYGDDDLDKNPAFDIVNGKWAYGRDPFLRIGRDFSSLADLPSAAVEPIEKPSQVSFPESPGNNDVDDDDDDLDKNPAFALVNGKYAQNKGYLRFGRDFSSLADLHSAATETNQRASQENRI